MAEQSSERRDIFRERMRLTDEERAEAEARFRDPNRKREPVAWLGMPPDPFGMGWDWASSGDPDARAIMHEEDESRSMQLMAELEALDPNEMGFAYFREARARMKEDRRGTRPRPRRKPRRKLRLKPRSRWFQS